MNLSTTLPDSVTDTIRHAAETTRHAAATTAHTLSTLADEAHHRLEDVPVPGRPRHSRPRARVLIVLAVGAAVAAVIVRRRRGSGADDQRIADPQGYERAATDAGPIATSTPLTSVS